MVYFAIAAGVFFITGIIFTILENYSRFDTEELMKLFLILTAISICLIPISGLVVTLFETENKYQVVYEDGNIKKTDNSIFTLRITERVSYNFFKKGVKEYTLYKNTDCLTSSKKLDDIKKYFEPDSIYIEE